NPTFAQDDFKMEENMAGDLVDSPVSSQQEETVPVFFALDTAGASRAHKREGTYENGRSAMMTADGEKSVTLVHDMENEAAATATTKEVNGEIVNLGIANGALSDNGISWSKDGIDYFLASDSLTREELIEVAGSVQGKEVK